ncbi:hypothetical protein Tco_0921455 [Tanacetum coccineum]
MKMVDDNVGNQNVENMNGLSVVPEIANQYGYRNVVTTLAEGNGNGINAKETGCCLSSTTAADWLNRKKPEDPKHSENLSSCCCRCLDETKESQSELHLRIHCSKHPSSELSLTMIPSKLNDQLRTKVLISTSRVKMGVVPNKPVKTSVRIKPITVSQPNVIHKQQANSDSNGFSSTRVNNTTKTRRPHPRSNSNTDRVPSKSKSSCLSNNVEKIKENHRNSQIPKNQKHMSSECITLRLPFEMLNPKLFVLCVNNV